MKKLIWALLMCCLVSCVHEPFIDFEGYMNEVVEALPDAKIEAGFKEFKDALAKYKHTARTSASVTGNLPASFNVNIMSAKEFAPISGVYKATAFDTATLWSSWLSTNTRSLSDVPIRQSYCSL